MAAENAFLGGYKVGLISASLLTGDYKKAKKRKGNEGLIFESSEALQPTFIPVKKEKKVKNEDDLAKQSVLDTTAEETDENIPTRKTSKSPKNKSCDDDPERLARTIFVGNLPLSISRKDLKTFFKKYGDVESSRLRSVAVPDLKTSKKVAAIRKTFNPNRNNVNGYVVFKDKKSVEESLSSNGKIIDGLHIRVDRVDNGGKQHDHKRSVFVGNLIFDMKEETLSEFFSPCGEVLNARVIRDSTTGIGKGFGYVLFKEASSVSLALKMNNSELSGRKIRIQRSQENPKGSSTSNEQKRKSFHGMQAKERFYHKRKMLKQQTKFGLSKGKTKKTSFNSKVSKKHIKAKRTSHGKISKENNS
ncbi:RNA-binding protein 34-like [Dendronephthya gigantea]|uniref:RNA-binding protein 34-like n=1 Tax=Dendronephthya gigantea TaxID=151771 RepID=UPI00106AB8B1|nr:RNA-binding protein 34-like [Dendronephthya gigantea]